MKIKYLKDKCVDCRKTGPCVIIYGYNVVRTAVYKKTKLPVLLKGNWPICIRCLSNLAEDEIYGR
jgi:hypothetical protein